MKKLFIMLLFLSLLTSCVTVTPKNDESGEDTAETSDSVNIESEESSKEEILSGIELYIAYCEQLKTASGLKLDIEGEKTTTVGNQSFVTKISEEALFTGRGTESFGAKLFEKHLIKTTKTDYQKFYSDGIVYAIVNERNYYSYELSVDELLAELPIVAISKELYGNIEEKTEGDVTELTFSNASAAESWALPTGAEFKEATACATISSDDELTESIYTLSYIKGDSAITVKYNVKAEINPEWIPEKAPDAKYMEVADFEAVEAFEDAHLYIQNSLSVSLVRNVCLEYFETGSYNTKDEVEYCIDGIDVAFLTNGQSTSAYDGNTTNYNYTESAYKNIYTFKDSSGVDTTQTILASSLIYAYRKNIKSFSVFTKYTDSFGAIYADGEWRITFSLGKEAMEDMLKYMGTQLYGDQTAMEDIAYDYRWESCMGSMTVDAYTGLTTSLIIDTHITHAGANIGVGALIGNNRMDWKYKESLTLDLASETAPLLYDTLSAQ